MKTLTNSKNCSENRIRVSVQASLSLIGRFSRVGTCHRGLSENFHNNRQLSRQFMNQRQLFVWRNKDFLI
jgi:hypothetical protein